MKSKRSAVLDSTKKQEARKKKKKATNSQFVKTDDWGYKSFEGYDCLEHARWALVLKFVGIKFSYQPETVGCTYDLVMKPTFFLVDTQEWLHLCERTPTMITTLKASMVAEKTQKPVSVAQGTMFVPDIDAPSHKQFAMPLWHTRGEGHSALRYLCEVKRVVSIKYTRNILDCTTQKLCAAFRHGCALVRSPVSQSASRTHRSGTATAL